MGNFPGLHLTTFVSTAVLLIMFNETESSLVSRKSKQSKEP